VVALDFAAEMLTYARRREEKLPGSRSRQGRGVEWVEGDATSLPFPESSFDAATMGYGLRNVSI
jgi:ubiquinone/menaquinone biosynthesis C-methylase UbiE